MHAAVITFDTDWAPDWCVRQSFDMCREAGIGATFFATNPLPVLHEIAENPCFEIGIHPNFCVNTTQLLPDISASNLEALYYKQEARLGAVFDYCRKFAPAAQSMRTHGLWQSSSMYTYIEENIPTIINDVSTFIPYKYCYRPIPMQISPQGRKLLRFVFNWEDDVAIVSENFHMLTPMQMSAKELYIYNFHPIHVFLNSYSHELYNIIRKKCFNEASRYEICKNVNTNRFGVKNYLESIISQNLPFYTISGISNAILNGKDY